MNGTENGTTKILSYKIKTIDKTRYTPVKYLTSARNVLSLDDRVKNNTLSDVKSRDTADLITL